MSTVTPDQGIIIPVGTDGADNPQAFIDQTAGVESRLVLRYTNLADRTARHTAPVEGQITDLAAESRADAYDGAAYISAGTRGLYARRMRTTNAAVINNSTALVSDATLTVPLDVTGVFRYYGRIYYSCATAADIKAAFTFPAVAANGARWGAIGREAATPTNVETYVADGSGVVAILGGTGVAGIQFFDFDGFISTTATGNLVTQYAQNTANVSDLTVRFGSWLEVVKVG